MVKKKTLLCFSIHGTGGVGAGGNTALAKRMQGLVRWSRGMSRNTAEVCISSPSTYTSTAGAITIINGKKIYLNYAVLTLDRLILQFLAQCFRCICLHNVFIFWMNT